MFRPSVSVASLLVTLTAGMTLLAGSALAESPAVCDAYAKEAVADFHESQRYRCGFNSARFQDNYHGHYGWCLNAPAAWVQSETLFRKNELNICKGDATARRCRDYANTAVTLQHSNLASGCGFTGVRWQDSHANHLGWCLGVSEEAAYSEQSAREAAMNQCIEAKHTPNNPPGNSCAVYVTIRTTQCYNADGTPSSLFAPSVTQCGPDVNTAFHNAALALAAAGAPLSEDPMAGHCTYTYQVH